MYLFLRKSLLKNLFIGYDPVPVAEMAQEIVHVLEGGNSIYTQKDPLTSYLPIVSV